MLQGARQASASSIAGPRPNTSAILQSGQLPHDAAAAREGGRPGAGAESLVRRSAIAPCVSCGICGRLLRDATAFSECLHAFCRKCIYDKVAKDNIKCCPKCGILLGGAPLEKLRPDHSLQHIRSMIFPAKRRKVTMKKRKERVSSESTLSSEVCITAEGSAVLTPAASERKAQKVVVEEINEADERLGDQELVFEASTLDLAPIGRDALSNIRCLDFDSACSLTEETGALIAWQPSPFLEKMSAYNQLAFRQDPENFRPPATSDTDYQRQGPTEQMTNTPFMVGTSSCARTIIQDDENLRGDILTMFNESITRIMGRYDTCISKVQAENAKLKEELEHERTAALERTRILEETHQRELENERAAAAERTRALEKGLQSELEREREAAVERIRVLDERLQTTASQNEALVAEIAKLHEELENGRAENQDLKSDILEKNDELATLKYYSDMFEPERIYLENRVEDLNNELDNIRKEHAGYVRQVLNAARAIPNDLANQL